MPQINLHVTPDFEADLAALMKARGLTSKSQAIRVAVHQAAQAVARAQPRDLSALRGFVARLPAGQQPVDGAAALTQIDAQMDAKLEKLARGA